LSGEHRNQLASRVGKLEAFLLSVGQCLVEGNSPAKTAALRAELETFVAELYGRDGGSEIESQVELEL